MPILRPKKSFLVTDDPDEFPFGVEMKPFVALTFNEEPFNTNDIPVSGAVAPRAENLPAPRVALTESLEKANLWMRFRNLFPFAG